VWGEIQSQAQSVGVYNLSRLWVTYQALSNCGVTQARSDGRNTFRATDPNKPEKSISNYLSKPERRKTMSEAKLLWSVHEDRKEVHLLQAIDLYGYEKGFTLYSNDDSWGGQSVEMPMSIEDIKSLHKVLGDTLTQINKGETNE